MTSAKGSGEPIAAEIAARVRRDPLIGAAMNANRAYALGVEDFLAGAPHDADGVGERLGTEGDWRQAGMSYEFGRAAACRATLKKQKPPRQPLKAGGAKGEAREFAST